MVSSIFFHRFSHVNANKLFLCETVSNKCSKNSTEIIYSATYENTKYSLNSALNLTENLWAEPGGLLTRPVLIMIYLKNFFEEKCADFAKSGKEGGKL